MAEHRVADVADFEGDGSKVVAQLEGWEVAVFRLGGEYHAVANFCPHASGPLCEGHLTGRSTVSDDGAEWRYDGEERRIVCPWHGWTFDVATGENVHDDRYAVPTYDVTVREGGVFVER
jgi:nitrite reductase/ring-hydroxylating ferredoxin subunit